MKLKLSDWSSVAEVVSGIAVVITLIFLILGVRENTDVTRADVYTKNMDSLNGWRQMILENPDLGEVYGAYSRGDVEAAQSNPQTISLLVDSLFGVYEQAYFAYKYGVMGRTEWERYARSICRQLDRADRFPRLRGEIENVTTEEFSEYLDVLCAGDG